LTPREKELTAALELAAVYLEELGPVTAIVSARLRAVLGNDTKPERPAVEVDGVLYGADAAVMVAVSDLLQSPLVEVPSIALGIMDGNKIIGGAIFHSYREGLDIEAVVAMKDPSKVTKGMARRILAYPFEELKLPRMTLQVEESNTRAIKVAEGYGAKLEGKKRGSGINIYGLLPGECPFWRQ
jgi:hypothetical protein